MIPEVPTNAPNKALKILLPKRRNFFTLWVSRSENCPGITKRRALHSLEGPLFLKAAVYVDY